MMDIASIGSWCLGAYTLLLTVKVAAAHLRICRDSRAQPEVLARAPICILQPILGGDPALEECLGANLAAAGPETVFHWLLDEEDSTGQAAAAGAIEHAAATDATVRRRVQIHLFQEPPADVNPKSFKLARGLAAVDTEFVAVLDDDTTIDAVHLARAAGALDRSDLYTGLPAYRSGGGLGSRLIEGFVNGSSAVTYLPAALAAPAMTLNGMFYVTRTRRLRSLGGFGAIASELCDDLALARLYLRSGHTIHQGWTTQILRTEGVGLRAYAMKMHRWFVFMLVLLRTSTVRQRLAMGATLALGPPLLWVGVIGAAMNPRIAAGLVGVLVVRHFILNALLARASEGRARVPCVASIAAELLLPLHGLHALLAPRIRWRSRSMRVHPDGTFTTLDPSGEPR